jgi:hypothetical protein
LENDLFPPYQLGNDHETQFLAEVEFQAPVRSPPTHSPQAGIFEVPPVNLP